MIRGLDVFGGFLMDGNLHLMGEIREPFEESWIFPLGTATLEGRTFPAPADPDKLLTATYGTLAGAGPGLPLRATDHHRAPAQRLVPRPSGRAGRAGTGSTPGSGTGFPEPSPFVDWVAHREPEVGTFVDVGCGRGADVLYMASRGVPSIGLDFQARSYAEAERRAEGDDSVEFWPFNLLELRQSLAVAAIVARRPGPRVVVARHLVDTIKAPARRSLWRVARMMTASEPGRSGGRLHLEFLVRRGDDGYAGRHRVRRRKAAMIVGELEASGATVLHREMVPVSEARDASIVCRLVVEWRRGDGG